MLYNARNIITLRGVVMKTKFALAFYYLAIGFLVVFAGVIIVKLVFWPPCTQVGNACVVDGWSVAGLAAMMLAVAATVLAILGAVAVAAWWTSLNERVNDQVTQLYEAQKKEVNTQVDLLLKDQKATTDAGINALLKDQQKKVEIQFQAFETTLVSMRQEMTRVQASAELANDLVKKTYERSEQQVAQLQQVDLRARESLELTNRQLGEARRQAGVLDGILKGYGHLAEAWSKTSTVDERVKLIQQLLERDAPLPRNSTATTADSSADNSTNTTPTPADSGPASS